MPFSHRPKSGQAITHSTDEELSISRTSRVFFINLFFIYSFYLGSDSLKSVVNGLRQNFNSGSLSFKCSRFFLLIHSESQQSQFEYWFAGHSAESIEHYDTGKRLNYEFVRNPCQQLHMGGVKKWWTRLSAIGNWNTFICSFCQIDCCFYSFHWPLYSYRYISKIHSAGLASWPISKQFPGAP